MAHVNHKGAIITGDAPGIGRAMCIVLAKEGAGIDESEFVMSVNLLLMVSIPPDRSFIT